MPTYEYICTDDSCAHEFETFQSMKDDSLVQCPICNQDTLKRKIGLGAGIIFKGSGFYETDYKKKSSSDSSSKSDSATDKPEKSSSAPAKDKKTETVKTK